MKNYSSDSENAKTFILNYSIKDDKIIVNLASNKEYTIPYSIDNEKRILNIMKKQVNNSNKYKLEQKITFSISAIASVVSEICLITVNPMFLLNSGAEVLDTVTFSTLFISCILAGHYKMIKSIKNIKDIEKNQMFVNNERLLNDNIQVNSNALENTSSKTKEIVKSYDESSKVTLNSIDKISYKDLKQIIENIKNMDKDDIDIYSIKGYSRKR